MRRMHRLDETVMSVSEIDNINNIWKQLISSVQNDIKTKNIQYYVMRKFCSGKYIVNVQNIGEITIKYLIYLLDKEEFISFFMMVEMNCLAQLIMILKL